MITDPAARPFILGALIGAVAPPGMKMLDVMVAVEGLLLVRLMKAPPEGAGDPKLTAKGTDDPGATTTPAGSRIPSTFINRKLAPVTEPTAALTAYGPPALPFAVNIPEVAIPNELVVPVLVLCPPKLPLGLNGPAAGAEKITLYPAETGLPPASVTVADSGLANAVLIAVDCSVPPDAAICAGGPGRFVSEKTADDLKAGLLAVTL